MAKANLPVNFKDDILKENMNGKRRFNMIQNSDGTVSFEDVTEYTQVGSTFGAAQINATNEAVNNAADASKIIDNLETIKANTQSGYIAGALAVKELNSNLGNKPVLLWTNPNPTTAIKNPTTIDIEATKYNAVIIKYYNRVDGDARDIYYKTIYKNTIILGTQFIFTYGSSTVRNLELTDTSLKIIGSNYPNNTKYAIPIEIYGFNTDTNFIQ